VACSLVLCIALVGIFQSLAYKCTDVDAMTSFICFEGLSLGCDKQSKREV